MPLDAVKASFNVSIFDLAMSEAKDEVRTTLGGVDHVVIAHPANNLASFVDGLADPTSYVLLVVVIDGLAANRPQPHSPDGRPLAQVTGINRIKSVGVHVNSFTSSLAQKIKLEGAQ